MIAVWMAYATLMALLLGLAAVQAERALRLQGRPGRWVWAAALAGTWILPTVTRLLPPSGGAPVEGPAGIPLTVDPLSFLAAPATLLPGPTASWLAGLDGTLLTMWALMAAAALALVTGAYRRLLRRSREWPEAPHLGERVVLSPDFGPAVLGMHKALIVLPRWVLGLDRNARRLVLDHEEEHRRARDTLLLAAGVAVVVAAPWNLPLWWHLRRLRLALELDCDRRVLKRGASPRRYGDLLLSVGQRMSGTRVPVAALAEPPSFLERRLKMIAERNPKGRTWRSAVALVAAGALVGVACETPAPSDVEAPAVESPVAPTPQAVEVPEDGALVDAARKVEGALRRLTGETPTLVLEADGLEGPRPLVIVDGVITAWDMDDFDELSRESDVAAVEVIKGSAAEALYGARARGGVIQITTKAEDAPAREARVLEGRVRPTRVAEPLAVSEGQGAVADRGTPSPAPQPVILVDGEVFGGTMDDLRLLDIQSIEVLKGPAIPAELGEEARARGVIRVTTRR